MMSIIERLGFESGEVIELAASGNGNPPDRQGGQHTNKSTLWVRVAPDGPWCYVYHRSRKAALDAVVDCDTAEDAIRALTGEEEGGHP